jgi:polysaccharide pyruvyl transferase WcaK-like protein
MIKILVLNAGISNKGNRALVTSTIRTIEDMVPNVEFSLMGPDKIDFEDLHIRKNPGLLSINKPYYTFMSLKYLIQCFFIGSMERLNIKPPIPNEKSPLYDYYVCDVIINSGGDTISGETLFEPLYPLLNIYYGVLMNRPVILYGESLGYFKNRIVKIIAKHILNKTSLIIVREDLSKRYLDDIGVTKPSIYVTSDPAFLLEPASSTRVSEIFSKEGIPQFKKPLIGINPSGLISRYLKSNEQYTDEMISDTMAKVIDDLVENLNADIVLIPHVYTSEVDDRKVIKSIFEKVENKSRVYVITNEYTPQELKGIIGQCDLFIGMRMHATIASTSMLIPTVGIAYSHKMYGIIGKTLGQEKYIIDINQLSYHNLILKIYDAWNNKNEIKNELEVKVQSVKDKALLNGVLVKNFLDKNLNYKTN